MVATNPSPKSRGPGPALQPFAAHTSTLAAHGTPSGPNCTSTKSRMHFEAGRGRVIWRPRPRIRRRACRLHVFVFPRGGRRGAARQETENQRPDCMAEANVTRFPPCVWREGAPPVPCRDDGEPVGDFFVRCPPTVDISSQAAQDEGASERATTPSGCRRLSIAEFLLPRNKPYRRPAAPGCPTITIPHPTSLSPPRTIRVGMDDGDVVAVDEKGRVSVPRHLRHQLGLQPGEKLVATVAEGALHLKPLAPERRTVRARRRWGKEAFVPAGEGLFAEE